MPDDRTSTSAFCAPPDEDLTRLLARLQAVATAHGLGHTRIPGALLVAVSDEVLEITTFAWKIVVQHGGLVNRADIAEMFGVTPGRAWKLSRQRYFPDPVGEIGGSPVWLRLEVERYREQPPPGGRPRPETPA